MEYKMQKRIEQTLGMPGLVENLVNKLPASDLQSLLIAVFEKKAGQISVDKLYRNYVQNPYVLPSDVNARIALQFDLLINDLLPQKMTMLELSPLSPLGTCAAIATVSQNKIVSTIRNTEVVSDATNLMTLECARRRKMLLKEYTKSTEVVRLCSSHRHTRVQSLKDSKHSPHFRIFCISSAGRDRGSSAFEVEQLAEHVGFYLELLKQAEKLGFKSKNRAVTFTLLEDPIAKELVHQKVMLPLQARFPENSFDFDEQRTRGRNYYKTACFNIAVQNEKGESFDLCDGGFTDWTQKLVNSKKERLMNSAFGSELFCKFFISNNKQTYTQ